MKKIFTLFAAVLMAGSMMAGNWIKFDDVYPTGTLDGVIFGMDFELTITDNAPEIAKRKVSIDESSATFGVSEENTISFDFRLKTGGKSSSSNKMTLVVPEEGPLVIFVRPASSSATNRNIVLSDGQTVILNHTCLDTDTVAGASSKIFLPVVVENIPAGTYELTYPVGAVNFYGFQLGYDEPAGPIELEFTSAKAEVYGTLLDVLLSGPNVSLLYEFSIDNKSIAGIHNDAKQDNIVLTYDVAEYLEDYILDGTAEFTFVSVDESGVYTYIVSFNLVGVSGNNYHAEAEIQVQADLSNDIIPTALDFTISCADGVVTATPNDNTVGYIMIVRDASFGAASISTSSYSDADFFDFIIASLFGKTDIKTGESEFDIIDDLYWVVDIDELVPGDYKAILAPCVARGTKAVRNGDIIVKNFTVVATPTALENTTATIKAQKVIENGQMVIIKNGVRYNALGAEF